MLKMEGIDEDAEFFISNQDESAIQNDEGEEKQDSEDDIFERIDDDYENQQEIHLVNVMEEAEELEESKG